MGCADDVTSKGTEEMN